MLGNTFDVNLKQMVHINYEDKLIKIQNLYKKINTPIGKFADIKTLLIWTLNHLFIALPSPPTDMINNLNNMFYDFIWEGNVEMKILLWSRTIWREVKNVKFKCFYNVIKDKLVQKNDKCFLLEKKKHCK
jgi:hypothetical protein